MIAIMYTSHFLRQFNKLPPALQDEVETKILLFTHHPQDPLLRTHKLKGDLRGYWSFSVNYSYRIVFEYDSKNSVALLSVGDHSVYD